MENGQIEYATRTWSPINLFFFPPDDEVFEPSSSSDTYLKSVSIFSGLSEHEIARFQSVAHPRAYKKGKVLYLEEESTEYFYVILSGWIKLFHTMPEGDEVIIDILSKGDLVGESAIFEKDRATSSAEAIEDVQLLVIPLRTLKEQIVRSQSLALSMLSVMSRHYRRHCSERALYAMQSAPQRVGHFLLKFCPKHKQQGILFHLPYDKMLIAETLGMKIETFSRALNILRQKTGLRIKGASVEIDSVKRLVEFVYGPLSAKYISVCSTF
jgi:CRP/FNR family transcriptional regulator, dissimilatory nitrate respiration regulator